MADRLPMFLKRKDKAILFDGNGEFFFYVPEKYFDLKTAFMVGDYINILGVLDYAIEDKSGKKSELKQFNYPTRFLTKPYQIDKIKNVKILSSSKPQDYRLFRYKKDDAIIVETKVPQEIENVEDLVNLFMITGNIPNTIPYDTLQNYFIENMSINGNSYGINIQIFGVILSELCRSTKDINTPFRLSKPSNMHDYQPISVKDVSKMVSAYSALTSENFDESIVQSMMNDKKINSPLEKVLMGE